MTLSEAYRLLGVSVGSPRERVRDARRDMMQLLHPDKHQDKATRLRKKSAESSRAINEAYELIESHGFPTPELVARLERHGYPPHAEPVVGPQTRTARGAEAVPPPGGRSSGPHPPDQAAPPPPRSPPPSNSSHPSTSLAGGPSKVFGIGITILVAIVVFVIRQQQREDERRASASVYSSPVPYSPSSSPSRGGPQQVPNTSGRTKDFGAGHQVAAVPEGPSPFYIGSSRAEVEAAQGTPTSVDKSYGEVWWYGAARVSFKNGKVTGWDRSDSTQLNASWRPTDPARAAAAGARGTFALGSDWDEVYGAQGTPTSIDRSYGEKWWYSASSVTFKAGKVVGWDRSINSPELKVTFAPKNPAIASAAASRGYYQLGATRDEVAGVEGPPTSLDQSYGEVWWYGASRLEFRKGRVSEYDSVQGRPLQIRLAPSASKNDDTADVEGFMNVIFSEMENALTELCKCTDRTCSKAVAKTLQTKGQTAGYAYTSTRKVTKELKTFLATRIDRPGSDLVSFIKINYMSWFADYQRRFDICVTNLPP